MSKHHPDLVLCRKQPGTAVGRLCGKCEGKCVVCDSLVRQTTVARICDECNYGSFQGKCVICGGSGVSEAFYCHECTVLERDRDGCPKVSTCRESLRARIPLRPRFAACVRARVRAGVREG
jgi:PHD finger-like domain-containing protein 5A